MDFNYYMLSNVYIDIANKKSSLVLRLSTFKNNEYSTTRYLITITKKSPNLSK